MTLAYSPKVGEVLECDFGDFVTPPLNPIFNGLISPEMRKKRMVIVLNGKLPNGCCLVIPISSSGDANSVQRGFHVYLPPALLQQTNFYDKRDRWAIAECVTHVSKQRLNQIKDNGAVVTNMIPRDFVTQIQKAVIKTLSAATLIATGK